MLWEQSGNLWSINQVFTNSSMQLFSFDLSTESQKIFFNEGGKTSVLDTVVQEPWAPPGAPFLGG